MSVTKVYICPGIHPPALTEAFLSSVFPLDWASEVILGILPPHLPPYAPGLILDHLEQCLASESSSLKPCDLSLVWIGFSAGVVGGMLAARQWQRRGYAMAGFIAVDGWGMPLWADFPVYSLSPHRCAYDTSAVWRSNPGGGDRGFYADPPCTHWQLWQKPEAVWGWDVRHSCGNPLTIPPASSYLTARQYIDVALEAMGLVVKRNTFGGGQMR